MKIIKFLLCVLLLTISSAGQAQVNYGAAPTSGVTQCANALGQLINCPTPMILSTTTGISGTTIANTALYTVPSGKTAIITGAVVRCTAANTVTVPATAGIGNVAGTNNVIGSSAMTSLTATTAMYKFTLSGASITTAAAGIVYLNIGTGATATSQTLAVDLIGYVF